MARVRNAATTPAATAHAAEVPLLICPGSNISVKLLGAHKSGLLAVIKPGPCDE